MTDKQDFDHKHLVSVLATRIDRAIERAVRSGSVDGDHHKNWCIDQMVRELTGCPTLEDGSLGESKEYQEIVREAKSGEDGPETYSWDTGIPP